MTEYSPAQTEGYPRIFPNFQNCVRCEKYIKDNKLNSLHLAKTFARIFLLGLSENCSLLRKDDVRGQLSMLITHQIFPAKTGEYPRLVYTTQVNSTFRARWLASSEVISQVLFTSEQPKKNKMAFVAILSEIKLLFGPLLIQLVWYILKQLFTSVSLGHQNFDCRSYRGLSRRMQGGTDKMNQIACCDWLPEQAKWSYLAYSGLPAVSRVKNFPESHWPSFFGQDGWILAPFFFFCEFMDLDSFSVHAHAKKNLTNIQPSWPCPPFRVKWKLLFIMEAIVYLKKNVKKALNNIGSQLGVVTIHVVCFLFSSLTLSHLIIHSCDRKT